MSQKEHIKHSKIARPGYGHFARNEWAILGAPCGDIKKLAEHLIEALAPLYHCGYVDAHHAKEGEQIHLPGRLAAGATMEYTDQIHFHQLHFKQPTDSFEFRKLFSHMDLVLVNGNHQQAKAQVVIIDQNKKGSLQKRVSQLTNVQLILLADESVEVFDFIKEAIPDWQDLPVLQISELDRITAFLKDQMKQAEPPLSGLVLAGGKSLRMGLDKGAMNWHGKEQRYHLADLLSNYCKDVFLSCRPEQQGEIDPRYKVVPDTFAGLGPYGAILSAFREQPDSAWLIIACDLPLLNSSTLQYLVEHRNPAALSTTFKSPHDGFPEPLIAIWEPKSYPQLLAFLAQGYTCPRKVLRNSAIELLDVPNPEALMNVNTPEEAKKVKALIS